MAEDAVTVRHNRDEMRFEVYVGEQLAGFTRYRVRDTGRLYSFVHTEIDSGYEGRGLGTTLIQAAMDDARSQGIAVLPYCPFVKAFIGRHPEYLSLVPEAEQARFGLA